MQNALGDWEFEPNSSTYKYLKFENRDYSFFLDCFFPRRRNNLEQQNKATARQRRPWGKISGREGQEMRHRYYDHEP